MLRLRSTLLSLHRDDKAGLPVRKRVSWRMNHNHASYQECTEGCPCFDLCPFCGEKTKPLEPWQEKIVTESIGNDEVYLGDGVFISKGWWNEISSKKTAKRHADFHTKPSKNPWNRHERLSKGAYSLVCALSLRSSLHTLGFRRFSIQSYPVFLEIGRWIHAAHR